MSQLARFLLLIVVIAAVSTGVYFIFEQNESGPEEAAEELNEAVEELEDTAEDLQSGNPNRR